jgi:hypothetical protein
MSAVKKECGGMSIHAWREWMWRKS